MTTTEFHKALLQGRGSCWLAVRSDPEAYREEVLWACRELVAFDTQCEGSRAWFIYNLVCLYPDRTPFVRAACDALLACPSDGSWHVSSLAELVELFFQDGDQNAWKVLVKKYRMLYHQMRHVGPPEKDCYWAERDDFERLAVILSWTRERFLDIARDIGRLSLETEWLREYEFDWLYHRGRRYLRSLTKAAEKDPLLEEFLRVHETAYQEFQAQLAQRRSKRLPWNCRDQEKIQTAVEKYRSAVTPEEKEEALDAFFWTPYPDDPAPILADALSDHELLRHRAWNALRIMQHPAVRQFAIEHLADEEDAFEPFCANYERRDEPVLLERLRAVPIDFECTTSWHGDQLTVLRMDKRKPLAPRAALEYIFSATYCSECRADALRQLGKRHMLTSELLSECRYDANDKIRAYARLALNRRKPK